MSLEGQYMILEGEFMRYLRDCGQVLPKYLPQHHESYTVVSTPLCRDDLLLWDGRHIYCSPKIGHKLTKEHEKWRKMQETPLWRAMHVNI